MKSGSDGIWLFDREQKIHRGLIREEPQISERDFDIMDQLLGQIDFKTNFPISLRRN